jgi:hypothetical protein
MEESGQTVGDNPKFGCSNKFPWKKDDTFIEECNSTYYGEYFDFIFIPNDDPPAARRRRRMQFGDFGIPAVDPAAADPFATTADPFGATTDPFATTTDPFATTADPFGATTDPFAIIVDPLGLLGGDEIVFYYLETD